MSNEIPMFLFILMGIVSFVLLIGTFNLKYPVNLITGIVNIMVGYFLAGVSINGQLTQSFGEVIIVNPTMGWIFSFIALISVILTVKIILDEINYNLKPNLEADL